jgi:dienelactone hydrolase
LHLAQAQSNRGPRGRKKDFPDAERLVKRLVARELTLSFVPDAEQRLWRTVTRRKYQLTRNRVRLQNQLESFLEEAHIKLSSLVSDLLGLSARRMLKALADGETNPAALAALADQRLRATPAQLCDALGACAELSPVYRRLLKMALEELRLIDEQIGQLDQEMANLLSQHQDAVKRLAEVPGLDDAQAAVNLLLRTPAVDPQRIYLIGHSLGGMLAPRIAATNAEISGIVILAGPSRPIEQCLVDQTKYLVKLSGMNSEEAERQVENVQKVAHQIEDPNLKPESIVDSMGTHIPGSYWLDLRNYNAVESAARLSTPILVLQGGRDYAVSEANFEGWKTALDGHANASFKLYPNLNHLFIAGSGVSTPAEYNQPGHVAQEVIDDIREWIEKKTLVSLN